MTDRKPRPLWPLLTAALIGLPVLYVASLLPIGWLCTREMVPEDSLAMKAIDIYFAPVYWAHDNGPEWLVNAINWLDELVRP